MKHLKRPVFTIIVATLIFVSSDAVPSPDACHAATSGAATCTGATPCRACKNCRYCKHCAKEGGTCGVCRGRKPIE